LQSVALGSFRRVRPPRRERTARRIAAAARHILHQTAIGLRGAIGELDAHRERALLAVGAILRG
jgi:hypothetical protein